MIERIGASHLHVTVRSHAKDECVLEQLLLKGRCDCRDGNDALAVHTYWAMEVRTLEWRDAGRGLRMCRLL